jgi:UDP-N-acetylmuramoylalanine--D-glutamate ligase
MCVKFNGEVDFMYLKELALQGKHNVYNSMAAAIAAKAIKIDKKVIRESLMTFTGVEHRMEKVLKIRNVMYINDSKATNVDSVWYALESMTRPVVWIAGGTDKGNNYSPLLEFARKKVHTLICMGVDNSKLERDFAGIVPTIVSTDSLDSAMRAAVAAAKSGDTVLLSPACASFDLFKNYCQRGELFKEWVNTNLKK